MEVYSRPSACQRRVDPPDSQLAPSKHVVGAHIRWPGTDGRPAIACPLPSARAGFLSCATGITFPMMLTPPWCSYGREGRAACARDNMR